MRKLHRIVLWAVLVGVTPMVAGCANFDPDNLDIFGLNEKKKLPGERHDLFPGGVPGVTQGIPPEYLKSNQGVPDRGYNVPPEPGSKAAAAEGATAPAAEPAKPKAKPKPKPKRVAKPASKPTRIPVASPPSQTPAAEQQQQQAPASTSAWPAPAQSAPSSSSAWPAPQPSGTFQR
ncbi:MAG: hypothetical protein JSR61_09140 [Proteobacteria bacterium]|nr:hypothetical protein [Pseudomonadota bacterium]